MRVELLAILTMAALVVTAAVVVAARLAAFDLPAACLAFDGLDPACAGRQYDAAAYQAFAGSWIPPIRFFATLVPPLAGLILGIATVGKELDQRTAVLAWSVGPSRRRWLFQRVVPTAVVVAVLGIGAPVLADALMRLERTGDAFSGIEILQPAFETMSTTGLAPALVGLSAYGLTVLVGAMLGRLLPALLASLAFVVFATLIVQQGNDWLMSSETLIADQAHMGAGRQVDSLLRTPDGRVIRWDDAFPAFADPETGMLLPGVTEVARYVPIEILPQVTARFLLLHAVIALVSLTFAFAVVDRRSP
jgi:hypothetical protein